MVDIDNLKNDYVAYGYAVCHQLFDEEDITRIRKGIQNCIDGLSVKHIFEEDGQTIRSIMGYHELEPSLNYYSRSARVLKVVSELIGPEFYISQSKINLKAAKGFGKKWDYHRGFTYWNQLDGMPQPSMVSVFICLTEQTVANGAVFVLPGSHKNITSQTIFEESKVVSSDRNQDTSSDLSIQLKPDYIQKYERRFEQKYLLGQPGDVFFMDPRLLHASNDNQNGNSRDLMITVYNPVSNLPSKLERPSYLCERNFEVLQASI